MFLKFFKLPVTNIEGCMMAVAPQPAGRNRRLLECLPAWAGSPATKYVFVEKITKITVRTKKCSEATINFKKIWSTHKKEIF
jgi:hypothetical protein